MPGEGEEIPRSAVRENTGAVWALRTWPGLRFSLRVRREATRDLGQRNDRTSYNQYLFGASSVRFYFKCFICNSHRTSWARTHYLPCSRAEETEAPKS